MRQSHRHPFVSIFINHSTPSWAPIALSAVVVLIVGLLFRASPKAQSAPTPVSVLTQHNDNGRSGANLNETVLNTSNVNVNQFGLLFARAVDGQVYAQPLYVPGVTIGQTVHNVVYVATMRNNLYAFDADDPAATTPLWQVNFGPPVPVADTQEINDINDVIGITGTPVIDPATKTLYCVAKTKEGTSYFQRLHAIDITTGLERLGGPAVISGSVIGAGDASVNGTIAFDPLRHLNRPALLLTNGFLYIAFGSHGDYRPFHGWVFSYDATTLQSVATFNVSSSGWGGSMWQSGQGLATDASGFIYFMTANGIFDMNAGGQSCSSCFIKLSTPTLTLVDWFAPYNQNDLNVYNVDLASSGPLLLPGTNRLIGGGKEGKQYVIDRSNMGHFQAGSNSQIVQDVQITPGNHLHGSPIYWESPVQGPIVYMWYEENALEAFRIVNGAFENNVDPTTGLLIPNMQSTMKVPAGMPGGVLSLSANGSTSGTGIVWATTPFGGDAQQSTVAGIFRAFDATNLSKELWDSKQNAVRDDIGNFAKFTPPTVANGKVYVASFSNQLLVYGLLSTTGTAPTLSNVAPGSGSTAGGTAITLTGTNFATGASVRVGGMAATGVNVVNSTTITATTPAHAAGTVAVTVTNPDDQAATLGAGFTYVDPTVPISFVQVASATPQSPTASVQVTYPSLEVAGDLNIVAVGWNDTVATVQSVQDNAGNQYLLAIGPTSGTGLRQSIYYASNIVGGTNTVTVTFSQAAAYPDIRILEYRGLGAVDVTAGASGTGTTSASGAATTTSTNELIFGANMVSSYTSAAGSGFTSRVITYIDNDLAEDMIVTAAGSYNATATLGSSGNWVMQMATFKPASSGSPPAPAPTVSSIAPTSGSTAGGTAVTITGTNFTTGATVSLGGTAATGVSVVNSTTITATTPAHAAGAVNVTVTNTDTRSGTLTSGFTYAAAGTPPTVTSIAPTSGPTTGGTAVTIKGTNFTANAPIVADVFIDMNVSNAVGSTLSVPMMTSGTIGTFTKWTESPEPPTGFTLGPHLHNRNASVQVGSTIYTPDHPSKSLALDNGKNLTIEHIEFPSGHTAVTIAGLVTFGPVDAGSSSNLYDYWEIQAGVSGDFAIMQLDNGRGAGVGYGVAIETNPNGVTTHSPYIKITPGTTYWCVLKADFSSGTARLALYEIVNWSLVGNVSSTQAAGGQQVGWINIGNNEIGQSPGTTSYFENMVIDYTSATFPLGPGAPTNTTVAIGGNAATNVIVTDSATITGTTPGHAAGAADVTVTNGNGQSGTLSGGFTYVAAPPPTLSSVAPNTGPTTGGTAITITGNNFAAGASVAVGGTAATGVSVVSATTINATTPAHAAGVASVTVTNGDGQSGTLSNAFTYTVPPTPISFAQVASATPQSPTATVQVDYPGPQTAGDLNIVAVGWNDTVATVGSVQDSAGNPYALAIGPTSGTGLRQSIYYAKNIVGGTNTVTVTFSQAATYPDVRILEYRGLGALDVTAAAVGTGTTSASGAATTTAPNELIFGASIVSTSTKAAGSGFTARVVTYIDSDLAEDMIVTSAGSYTATATLGSRGNWVMQMVTFRPAP